jgi:hypothetical protein
MTLYVIKAQAGPTFRGTERINEVRKGTWWRTLN